MRFQIDWASLIVGSKFTVFALFYFVLMAIFQAQVPGGAYIWRGDFTDVFLPSIFLNQLSYTLLFSFHLWTAER